MKRNVRQSNSHNNLVDNQYYVSEDDGTRERKGIVKRTKSFWKFGKNSSDNEILEGMALWRHRDLVDVEEQKMKRGTKINSQERVKRDRSNDSDRTINANQTLNDEETKQEPIRKLENSTNVSSKSIRQSASFRENQKLPSPHRDADFDNEDYYAKKRSNKPKPDDQFYDDDGDGLMMKTVNRKNILQQYSNDSSGPASETESEITSDDPYDCILVDDQNMNKQDHFPNVAEIGKKLEKLSKSSKFSPNNNNTVVTEKNLRNNSDKKNIPDDIIQYNDKPQHSFKTFGVENGDKERPEGDRYYRENHAKRNNDSQVQEKRRYYTDSNKRNNSNEIRGRPSYESIDSDVEHHRDNRSIPNNRRSEAEKLQKYYDSTNDELSDAVENRQFIPRTKLTKTNSNTSTKDVGLMEYGETLQKRLKNPEYGAKYDEKSPHNGNMYGPWYDLWGLDASTRK